MENPDSGWSYGWTIFMVLLIVISSFAAFSDLLFHDTLTPFEKMILEYDKPIIYLFTFEFLVRMWATPSAKSFVKNGFNWIDLIAIAPYYLGFHSEIVRILRLFRIFRLAKFMQRDLLGKNNRMSGMFNMKSSVIIKVTPVVFSLMFVKGILMILETHGNFIVEHEQGTLLTVMGFALGIVLSQKVAISYEKQRVIRDSMYELIGTVSALNNVLNAAKRKSGDECIKEWLKTFIDIFYHIDKSSMLVLLKSNHDLYKEIAAISKGNEDAPKGISEIFNNLCEKSSFIINRKTSYIPFTYNQLLMQVTFGYVVLLLILIPGLPGMLATFAASYLLFSLYYVTDDFDAGRHDASGGLDLNPHRLEDYLNLLHDV